MKVKNESEVAQSCPTLSDPVDCSPPGSSIHGIFQARVLVNREMQIKTTVKYYYTSIRMSKLGLTMPSWGFHVLTNVNSAAINIRVGFPGGSDGKESTCPCRRLGFDTWVGKIPWRREWQPTSVFLLGKIPWTEAPGGLQSMGSHIGHYRATN